MNLQIKVKPNSKVNLLLKDSTGHWVMKVKSPPVDGKANEEVIRALSKLLKIPKATIVLVSGHTHPNKRFQITALPQDEILRLLEENRHTEK